MTSQRRCIVTHESLEKADLIRFCVSPDGVITPDIAEKLPGRGIWMKASRESVDTAIERKLFSKAAKQTVNVPDELADKVSGLLKQHALDALALCRKSGAVISGFDSISRLKTPKSIILLLHADDAGSDGINKLSGPRFAHALHDHSFTRTELSQPLTQENVVHVAIMHSPAGESFIRKVQRFTGFIGNGAL